MASVADPTLCKVCNEMQPSRLAYLVHCKSCKVKFPCGQCTETFKSKKGLAEHEKTHRVQFTCDLCETEPFVSPDSRSTSLWHMRCQSSARAARRRLPARTSELVTSMKCTPTDHPRARAARPTRVSTAEITT